MGKAIGGKPFCDECGRLHGFHEDQVEKLYRCTQCPEGKSPLLCGRDAQAHMRAEHPSYWAIHVLPHMKAQAQKSPDE